MFFFLLSNKRRILEFLKYFVNTDALNWNVCNCQLSIAVEAAVGVVFWLMQLMRKQQTKPKLKIEITKQMTNI